MSETPSAPAGWYDDPEHPGAKRYWNGTSWVDGELHGPLERGATTGSSVSRWVRANYGWLTLGVIAIVVAGIAIWPSVSESYDPATSAVEECKDYVRASLKSPSSAAFSPEPVAVNPDGDDVWEVIGFVDADNSFGASIRSNFDCKVRETGEGEWDLVGFDLG